MLEGHTIRRILPHIIDDLDRYHFEEFIEELGPSRVPWVNKEKTGEA